MIQNDVPLVSVYCLSYNHEKYIKDALEGIISQKVNFKYEVIVHDDASTDKSQEIIREYAERYPDIIKPIFQTENQYSKGIKIVTTYILPKIKGKYTAICECDDYWTDPMKLQKQVDLMENQPEVSICSHAFDTVTSDKKLLWKIRRKEAGYIANEDIIMRKDIPQTATFMYRTNLRKEMPDFLKHCSVGDYPLVLYMVFKGKFYYFSEVMSCYRKHGNGSWVTRMKKDDDIFDKHINSIIEMLIEYNDYTEKKYEKIIGMRISQCQLLVLERYGRIVQIIKNDYYKTLTPRLKISKLVKCFKNLVLNFKKKK